MRTASYLIAVVLGLALTLGAVPAQAETTNCTPITTLPAVITVQGVYLCLPLIRPIGLTPPAASIRDEAHRRVALPPPGPGSVAAHSATPARP